MGERLGAAATDLDGTLVAAPTTIDAGLATDLLGAILFLSAEAVSSASAECEAYRRLLDAGWQAYQGVDDDSGATYGGHGTTR